MFRILNLHTEQKKSKGFLVSFYQSRDLDMSLSDDTDYNVPLSQDEHHQKLNEHSKHRSIAHLIIQAIMSKLNEFAMML